MTVQADRIPVYASDNTDFPIDGLSLPNDATSASRCVLRSARSRELPARVLGDALRARAIRSYLHSLALAPIPLLSLSPCMTRLKPFEQRVIHSCCGREFCGKPPLFGDRRHVVARSPKYGLGMLRLRR